MYICLLIYMPVFYGFYTDFSHKYVAFDADMVSNK